MRHVLEGECRYVPEMHVRHVVGEVQLLQGKTQTIQIDEAE